MNKTLLSILCLFLASCAPNSTMPATMRLNATQGLATPSIVPTATVYWQGTANVASTTEFEAKATAQAANIAVAVITADAKQAELETARITQEAYAVAANGTQVVINATASAYPVSVALTATQQAALNTQIPLQQALQSGQLTATHEAPEIMNAMTRAQDAQKYSWVETFVRLFVLFAMGICLLAIAAFAFKYQHAVAKPELRPMPAVETYQEPAQVYETETVLTVNKNTDSAYPSSDRLTVPCTPDQFTALVTGVLSEGKSLAINVWEGAGSPFTRAEYQTIRNWLLSNRLAQSAGQGALILSAEGESIFIEWLNAQTLPTAYKFEKENA